MSLAALWLASHANKHVDSSFAEFGKQLAKQVRDAQAAFQTKSEELQNDLRSIERDIENIKNHERNVAEKLNTLTQRVKVLEHDLKNMTEALPPQILQRRSSGRTDRSA